MQNTTQTCKTQHNMQNTTQICKTQHRYANYITDMQNTIQICVCLNVLCFQDIWKHNTHKQRERLGTSIVYCWPAISVGTCGQNGGTWKILLDTISKRNTPMVLFFTVLKSTMVQLFQEVLFLIVWKIMFCVATAVFGWGLGFVFGALTGFPQWWQYWNAGP